MWKRSTDSFNISFPPSVIFHGRKDVCSNLMCKGGPIGVPTFRGYLQRHTSAGTEKRPRLATSNLRFFTLIPSCVGNCLLCSCGWAVFSRRVIVGCQQHREVLRIGYNSGQVKVRDPSFEWSLGAWMEMRKCVFWEQEASQATSDDLELGWESW